ncbi:replication factor C small subunit [Candidatus Woesearchaeota archaeon]|nr:MAG: replication factor C small subunit, replication factor C small subunit [archaeon GW2011_AR18]MBS3161566.1 replication factor C small subunit [Candidatus Woesearchaeota archaeon]HIH25661.1 replication factor C small subunit [Nanoarchaeota archaeon]
MENSYVWTERYRPKKFEDVTGQHDIVRRLKALVEQKNIPHLLFSGPAGVGKTTLALVIARELYGDDWKQNFLELNASNDRGIDVIRNEVKDFAKTKGLANIPFKLILLDECDALTKEAQQALRRTMETYSSSCRFVLSCNFVNKVIDPIKSRCAIFKFKPLRKEDLIEIVKKITKDEGLVVNESTITRLYELTGGDIRQLQNVLQSCASTSKTITEKEIDEFASKNESKDVKEIVILALNKKFILARNKLLDTMLNNGLSGIDILKQIQREIMELDITDDKKLGIIERCGEVEFRLVEGANDNIQLEALLAYIARN